ncbi:MAG: GAF domain-containing protein [bacterium]|nr:GAF domain-containing protein [bacterium]
MAHKLPLDNNAIIVSPLNPGHCNCPLHCNDRQGQALTARLILDNNRFGFICVSLPDNTPIGDSEISLFKDVVQDISFALHTIKMEERRSQTEMEIKRVNRALKVISESDKALVHESDETALLKKICRIIADSGGYRLAWAGYAENDPEKSIQPVAVAGDRDYISALDISWGDNKKGQCPAGFAVRSGKPFIVNDPSSVYWCGCDSQLGYQSYIALPLVYQQQTFGTLNIYADEPDAFGKEEVSLLSGLADDLAYGIDVLRTRADRIVAEDLLKDYYKNIEFLSQNIPELIGLSFDDNIYHFLGEKLSELVDNAVILINSYNKNDNIMEICEVFGLGFQSQKLANLTGFSIKPALEKLLTGNKLEALPGELLFHGLSGRGLPGLNGFAIGFTKEGELFGSAVILLENSMELKNKEVIETFIHQASIILHRRHIEKELKESENKFRSLAEISPNAILIHRGREILYANSAATTITGFSREELMRMNFWEILSPQFRKPREKIGTQMLEGKGLPGRAEVMVKMKTGDLCWVELFSKQFDFAGEPAVLLTAVDIHEIKSAREKEKSYRDQLMQADKMIALGTLVSGVAHEINNPNNAIIINTPLLMDFWKNLKPIVDEHYEQQGNFDVGAIPYSDIPEAFSHLFEGIIDSSKRIKTIVDDLKNFARPNLYDHVQAVDVNDVVKQSAALLANMIRKATGNFKTEYFNELPTVNGNSQQLQQVVITLLQNACQAIQNSTQGIVVSTSCVTEKKIVIVTVKDEGEGIARKNIKYLSDPFFTTKRESGGTGLGLSVSSRIIEDHGGSLVVESEPGKGSVFKLILPFTVGDTETGNAASERSTKEKSKKEKLTGERRRKERRAKKKHVKKTV